MDSLDGWSVVIFLAAISCSDPVVSHYLIPWTLTNVHFTGQSAFCSYKEELWNNSRFILAIGKLTVTNLVTHWSADSVILAIHLKGTLSKDASWHESVQTFYFPGHLVLSMFMHLSCLAQSHISMMCTSEEQKKVFLWCNWLSHMPTLFVTHRFLKFKYEHLLSWVPHLEMSPKGFATATIALFSAPVLWLSVTVSEWL